MVEVALDMRGTESTGLQRANQVGTALGTAPYSSGLDWKQERQGGAISPIQEYLWSHRQNVCKESNTCPRLS